MAWPPSLYANCEQRPPGARGADIPAPRADPRTPGPAPSAALARFPAPVPGAAASRVRATPERPRATPLVAGGGGTWGPGGPPGASGASKGREDRGTEKRV